MRIVTATTLYPNSVTPRHGIFVEQRLLQLLKTGQLAANVVAPVPWFPWKGERLGRYGRYARVPAVEQRNGLQVSHPRYPAIPKVGMHLAPGLMALALVPLFRELKKANAPFVIDGHFLYPDGVALAIVGRRLGLPVVLTARGSDVNWFCRYPGPRAMMRWATRHSTHVVAVSHALRERLLAIGAPAERVTVLPNGVDAERFAPIDAAKARAFTGYEGFTLLSVGNLVPLKGHDLVIGAVARLPDVRLVIIGTGPEESRLRRLIHANALDARVRIVADISQDQLVQHYASADALVLASEREGMPNVVLESLACGTPVVATRAGGIPELITTRDAGVLAKERSVEGIAGAIEDLRRDYPDRSKTRAQGLLHGWSPTVEGLLGIYRRALEPGPQDVSARGLDAGRT